MLFPPKINNNLIIINLEKKYYNNLLRVVNYNKLFCDETINFLSFLENIDDLSNKINIFFKDFFPVVNEVFQWIT